MIAQRVYNSNHLFFDNFWMVYNESFPKEEKRNFLQQQEIFLKQEYTLNIYIEENTLKGFLAYWTFPNFIFVEHLAIARDGQGQGLGKSILQDFIKVQQIPVILEIEHPLDEISIRRLQFYQRLGFIENEYEHFQPPFNKNDQPLSLRILSLYERISEDLFNEFAEKQKHVVMNHIN